MEEKWYMDADIEVISMVNRGHGPGGELPSKVIRFIPAQNADSIIQLEHRIQVLKKFAPLIGLAAAFLLGLLL